MAPPAPETSPVPVLTRELLNGTVHWDSYGKVNSSFYSYCLYRHFCTFSLRARPCTQLTSSDYTVRRLDRLLTYPNLFCLIVLIVRRL
jgi:hypothetical protein